MFTPAALYRGFLSFGAIIFMAVCTGRGEAFVLTLDSVISSNSPAAGAGYISQVTQEDTYTFSGTNGQVIFLEAISVASAFQGWLMWDLRAPSGGTVASAYFNGTAHLGREALLENGTYTLRFRVGASNTNYIGAYSFRVRRVTSDQLFTIAIDQTISKDNPAVGAGEIDVPGANDMYQFTGTAGQALFFEEVEVDSRFAGWLQWILQPPPGASGGFSTYFDKNNLGRVVLTTNGTYTLRFASGRQNTNDFGPYSFRIRYIPPDQEFPIAVGDTVTNGVPAAGAGHIEVAGAQDIYTFQGMAGSSVFFENIAAAASLGGWLKWEVRSPSGASLFSSFFTGSGIVGRKDLTETGTYTMKVWVAHNNPGYIGTYSFRLLPIGDAEFPLQIGTLVTNGVPSAGAGYIEDAGGQDVYTFQGLQGQRVVFTELTAAAAFNNWLRWELLSPTNSRIAIDYFKTNREQAFVLPMAGTYKLRFFVGLANPSYVGAYSFRTRCDVYARPDRYLVLPGSSLAIPQQKFLCNDSGETGDVLQVDLPLTTSAQGGTLAVVDNTVVYTPPAGFVGTDTFVYRLRGQWGGESLATETVTVHPDANAFASVVSLVKTGETNLQFCLLGLPSQGYQVEQSTNLVNWTTNGNVSADLQGGMVYEDYVRVEPRRFFRFRKQ